MTPNLVLGSLAEAMILQALEDLFNRRHRKEGVRFLTGDGFRICSDIAGLDPDERYGILTAFGNLLREQQIFTGDTAAFGGPGVDEKESPPVSFSSSFQ